MVSIKKSKPIADLKKGDKIKIDGKEYEVDDHDVLIEHPKGVKEMAIDVFDSKTDKDFQIRYFEDNLELSFEFYELQNEFMYIRVDIEKVEW